MRVRMMLDVLDPLWLLADCTAVVRLLAGTNVERSQEVFRHWDSSFP